MYSDKKRKACESQLQDGVLLKQEREKKLSATFESEPYTVVKKNGNSVVVKSAEGVKYKRNVTHVTKFNSNETNVHGTGQGHSEILDESFDVSHKSNQDVKNDESVEIESNSTNESIARPQRERERKLPSRF